MPQPQPQKWRFIGRGMVAVLQLLVVEYGVHLDASPRENIETPADIESFLRSRGLLQRKIQEKTNQLLCETTRVNMVCSLQHRDGCFRISRRLCWALGVRRSTFIGATTPETETAFCTMVVWIYLRSLKNSSANPMIKKTIHNIKPFLANPAPNSLYTDAKEFYATFVLKKYRAEKGV